MNCDFFGLHDFDTAHLDLVNITVFIFAVNEHIAIISGDSIFVKVWTLPNWCIHNLFILVIYVVNRSVFGVTIFKIKSTEHTGVSKAQLINSQRLIISKREISFSDCFLLNIANIVIVCIILSTTNTDKHEIFWAHFPHCSHGNLNFV